MMFTVEVLVMPHKELLDPQGKAVLGGLNSLGITAVTDVRVGKRITLQVDAADATAAQQIGEQAAQGLLANQVMETFEVRVI